jgi:hypothetical protein
MVCDLTFDRIIGNPAVETPLSMVLFPLMIVSNISWTEAISNEPRRVTENYTKKLKKKGR